MEQTQKQERTSHFERLRRKVKIDLRTTLPSLCSKIEKSQKISENSLFTFQEYYQLTDKLGEGAHGVVKKAIEIQTSQTFAVKIQKADEQKIQFIKQNFLMCKFLKHPSIIEHHQLFINRKKEQAVLVMEYCPYPSLQSIYKTQINRTELAHIMKSLLEAVCELHKNGVCHRDLKLSNILYCKQSGNIKIIDLGISKLIFNKRTGQKQKMWSITGTMHYKAPEMFQGVQYDQKIDAWALGVIAYQLAYGKHPFSSQFQMNLIDEIINQQPQFQDPTSIQDNLLINFIKGLLRKDPKRRINCFQALRHPFIYQSQFHTKMFRYQDLFHLDKFSSNISRSRSLDGILSEHPKVEVQKVKSIKQLRLNVIQDNNHSC